MGIKEMLVQIDEAAPSEARLELAVGLARRHGAHLVGLHAVDTAPVAALGVGVMGVESGAALAGFLERVRDDAVRAAADLEARFRDRLRREDLGGEWRFVEYGAADAVALHGRYADLVVLGQHDAGDPNGPGWATVEAALFSSGRPVLVVPYAGRFPAVGRRVLIGWNASREATRAVHDALPLMHGAEAVTVLAIDPRGGSGGHGEEPAADIARHLARHGLRVAAAQTTSGGMGQAEVLLNRASEFGADLIVVGGYGHSRVREVILGGMTRDLLRRMTVPVLMSH